MISSRKADNGGEVTSSSKGANVRVLYGGEELERLHFASLQVPWSFVGRMRDEAERNDVNGVMTVDLAALRDGDTSMPIFADDFSKTFRDVFVRRFVPCLYERFNAGGAAELTRLPEDVSDAFRMLVLCERLKAVLKEDVKTHLDRLIVRSTPDVRPSEQAPFKIIETSLHIDATVPPRGSLQERVVQRATEMLASMLPDSLDALQELVQLACELGRIEMAARIFRSTAERALAISGVRAPVTIGGVAIPSSIKKLPPTSMTPASRANLLAYEDDDLDGESFQQASRGITRASTMMTPSGRGPVAPAHSERAAIEQEKAILAEMIEQNERQKAELRDEKLRLEILRSSLKGKSSETLLDTSSSSAGSKENARANGQELSSSAGAAHGTLALRQGIVLEKVGKSTGERIVRLSGDVLEWRKGSGRWTKEHTIMRQDVVNVKIVDASAKTFLLSTRTGLLTLRTLSDATCTIMVSAIESWIKGAPLKLKKAPSAPLGQQQHQAQAGAHTSLASRLARMSVSSFKRSSFRASEAPLVPSTRAPAPIVDYSFMSGDSFQDE